MQYYKTSHIFNRSLYSTGSAVLVKHNSRLYKMRTFDHRFRFRLVNISNSKTAQWIVVDDKTNMHYEFHWVNQSELYEVIDSLDDFCKDASDYEDFGEWYDRDDSELGHED